MPAPKRVADRLEKGLKTFRTVLEQQKSRDVSEADTVTLVKDILSEMFGYDKYAELTSEHSVRGTFCDLAIKVGNKLAFLLEVKAIGVELKDAHVKQSVDYASNEGCDWVILTNAIEWRLYQMVFKKPIDKLEVATFNLLEASAKSDTDMEKMFLITREGFEKGVLPDFCDRRDATSRFMISAIILNTDTVQAAIRREIRRISEISVDEEVIDKILRDEVLKRETIEGDLADIAARRVTRSASARKPAVAAPPQSQIDTAPAKPSPKA